MDIFVPLRYGLSDLDEIKESHAKRKFILFDELINLFVLINDDPSGSESLIRIDKFVVYINDNKLTSVEFDNCFTSIDQSKGLYKLNENFVENVLFRSSVVMNNGHNNIISFKFYCSGDPAINASGSISKHEDNEIYLESFNEVISWNSSNHRNSTRDVTSSNSTGLANKNKNNENKSGKRFIFKYPIYTSLNMRIRNTNIKDTDNIVLISLDFQNSKQLTQLVDTFYKNLSVSGDSTEDNFHLEFNEISLFMINNHNSDDYTFSKTDFHTTQGSYSKFKDILNTEISPVESLQFPLIIHDKDSYSIIYKLPFFPEDIKNDKIRCKVKVNLQYSLCLKDEENSKFSINTSWQTDLTMKKQPLSNSNLIVNNTSNSSLINVSTPRLNGGRFFMNTTPMLVNNKMNNIKFKFLKNNIVVEKGQRFDTSLQIINSSQYPLDLVVYYNNNSNVTNTKQDLFKTTSASIISKARLNRNTEGIILLSNDYKIPLILPNETYLVTLEFMPILSGFYNNLQGLKILDLESNELIDVGNSISILVQ
ncbi:hypothetical protein Kpol_538p22 [Vanderwaltozyma polyspora DSM 70294]|uniref:Trafficking protein particle complex II-specific subunit 65 n=1 Tax=Vanderwaltozyma polyspora (strain ATCC 22028 / DSM 70294 / BCRC 21397 / CBS 2163 / NBRC 10782 / NRRL Y-8283 / UCD 57-17) TaxID=436907 RepID=A7TKD5_VANPO|nr:uncharacterized protein Kpol_538p22 [Vanderwaltozyma polyspora DSM 70294]EDO17262.1 hypothetical protein Kpol_538p22 [Vanderwaltozyma polyspora DSM 70294]